MALTSDLSRDPTALVVALVRHGRTAWNAERRFLGCSDIPLDEEGHRQARALAVGVPAGSFDRVYSSPLLRAMETARYLHPTEPVSVPAVRELAQGELEGMKGPEAIARFPHFFAAWALDPTHAQVPGGEGLGACRDRAIDALSAIADQHALGERVAVVSHQMVIASLTCVVAGESLRRWRDHRVENTAMTVLEWAAGTWRIRVEGWRPPG